MARPRGGGRSGLNKLSPLIIGTRFVLTIPQRVVQSRGLNSFCNTTTNENGAVEKREEEPTGLTQTTEVQGWCRSELTSVGHTLLALDLCGCL